jgi:hypothetical protein
MIGNMKIWALLLCLLGSVLACRSQIADSHIEANVPKGALFDEYLKRDLKGYFCPENKDCAVEYELLRDGPTQTGISYPKYYLWARCVRKNAVEREGAVRVAAIEQKRFDVTNFLSRDDISKSPEQVALVFPSALVDKIVQKAHGKVEASSDVISPLHVRREKALDDCG